VADDPRAEFAEIAASLRAYLEWQDATGASGTPRRAAVVPTAPQSAAAIAQVAAQPSEQHLRLPQLAGEVAACQKCGLSTTRIQTVFARGNPSASLCFVGEAPGADEDAQGLPFVGRAGQLLEKDAYICNILKCRPPGNRRPEPDEIATCIPYLHEQLALVHPRVIVALGNTAVAALLESKLGITKMRGQWKLYRGQTLVMPTYHPSFLLRPGPLQTESKRQAWEDLKLVMEELGLSGKGAGPRGS